MQSRFFDRGYTIPALDRAFNIASKVESSNLLHQDSTNRNKSRDRGKHVSRFDKSINIPVFSTPYSLEFNKIKNTIEKYLPVLYNDPTYVQVLSKGIKSVSCRTPTIGGTLSPNLSTSRSHCPHRLQFKGLFRCECNGCPCCPHISRGDTIHSIFLNKDFKVSSFINCNTKCSFYVITCEQCFIQYAGCTTRRLRDYMITSMIYLKTTLLIQRGTGICHNKDVSSLPIQGVEKIMLS